jgi:DNA polymerase III epsilon subunit-like protein
MMNLMIDIETLGTKPGCAILSIAAVPFGPESEFFSEFYQRIDKDSNIDIGLISDPVTLSWWAKQSVESYAEAFGGTLHIREVLQSFYQYCKQFDKLRVWGNGASFDAPILEAAFAAAGMKAPWKYYDSMCYRTMKNLFPHVPFTRTGTAHNALEDAKSQADHLKRIFHFMEH